MALKIWRGVVESVSDILGLQGWAHNLLKLCAQKKIFKFNNTFFILKAFFRYMIFPLQHMKHKVTQYKHQ